MYVIYISKYKKEDAICDAPFCIYDNRSPAEDIWVQEPVVDLSDSKAGSVKFTLPLTHCMYDSLVKKTTIVTVKRIDKDDESVIFEGFVSAVEKDFYKNKTVFCEGFASYLNDSAQPAKEYFDISLDDYVRTLVSIHNERMKNEPHKTFSVGIVDSEFPEVEITEKRRNLGQDTGKIDPKVSPYEVTQFDSTFAYLSNLQSRCRSHLIFTKNPEGSEHAYNIDFIKNLPLKPNAQPIVFGENLLDYADKYDSANLCTAVLPIASANDYGGSKVGEVIMKIPDISVYYYETMLSLNANELYNGRKIEIDTIIHVGSLDKFYRVTQVNPEIIFVPLAGNGTIIYGSMLGWNGDEYGYVPVNINSDLRTSKVFTRRSFFPKEADGSTYYYFVAEEEGKIYSWNNNTFTEITDQGLKDRINGVQPYHVFEYHIDDSIKHLYLTSRTHNIGFNDRPNAIYDIGVEGIYNLETSKTNEEGWTSVADYDIDLSYESEGATYYGANKLYLAGWGDSLPTEIRREVYAYQVKDYTIGSEYGPERVEILKNKRIVYREEGKYYEIEDFGSGYDVAKVDVKGLDAVYISTRAQSYEDTCLWYITDGSGQMLTYEKIDTGTSFTSRIYYKVDLTKPETKGGSTLYFGGFGDKLALRVFEFIKTTGTLSSYMTVEGAKEYSEVDSETGETIIYHKEGSMYVESDKLIDIYGRIERKVQFNYIDNPEMLVNKAVDYLLNSQYDDLEIEVTGYDLHNQNLDISSFEISTMTPVISEFHGINKNYPVTELSIRLDSPDDSRLKFGETKTLEDRINEGSETI